MVKLLYFRRTPSINPINQVYYFSSTLQARFHIYFTDTNGHSLNTAVAELAMLPPPLYVVSSVVSSACISAFPHPIPIFPHPPPCPSILPLTTKIILDICCTAESRKNCSYCASDIWFRLKCSRRRERYRQVGARYVASLRKKQSERPRRVRRPKHGQPVRAVVRSILTARQAALVHSPVAV